MINIIKKNKSDPYRSKYEALDVCIEICGEEDKQVRESREKEVGGQWSDRTVKDTENPHASHHEAAPFSQLFTARYLPVIL